MAEPNHQQLLNAVLANPDADEPRLAYAGWCEAQPDPATKARAEFIRLQLQLARPAPDSQERRDLDYRRQRLETEYRAAWAGPLAPFTRDLEFDRGFVELVTMSARHWLEQAAALFLAAPVRHLNLTNLGKPGDNLLGTQLLSRLRSLRADSCGLEDHDVSTLAVNPASAGLRWLSLKGNQLGLAAAKALVTSPYLKGLVYVNFYGNPVDPVESYGLDDDKLVGRWLPPEGESLEREHGRIPWLHIPAQTIKDLVPNRFRLA